MHTTLHRHFWRHALLLAVVSIVGLLASAIEARAVLLSTSATRNTTPPSEDEGLAGWNIEATFGSYLATPIDATHFIAAQHIYDTVGSTNPPPTTITFAGSTYTVDGSSRTADPNSDLCIYSITGGTFPSYATLYNSSSDGPETGKTLTVFGKGWWDRGDPVYVGSSLAGWQWQPGYGVQSGGHMLPARWIH